MEYKNDEGVEDWKSDRFFLQEADTSFLKPKKSQPKKSLDVKIDEIFMKTFTPKGPVFEEGTLTVSQQLEDLFYLLTDKELNSTVVGLIRNSSILEFIHLYFDFIIKNHYKFEDYGRELMIACKLLAIFLQNHIYLPIEIEGTYLIKTLIHLAKSERDVEQAAGACALSFMIQPSCPLPMYVEKKFLPLAMTFRTSFNNNLARIESLHFIHEFIRYINDIPPDKIVQINEEIMDVFFEKNTKLQKEYRKLYPSCIEILQMELLNYPQVFPLLIEQNLLQTIHLFLASNKHKLIVAANHFFSFILTEKIFVDDIAPNINYSVVIDNVGYEIDLDVQKSSLWLLIDAASNGPAFIQHMYNYDILKHLNGYYAQQEISIKKLIFRLITNLLLNSSIDQERILFSSPIFITSYKDIQIFDQPEIYKYLFAVNNACQKLSSLDDFDEIKQILLENDFVSSLNDLFNYDSPIQSLANVLIQNVQSKD